MRVLMAMCLVFGILFGIVAMPRIAFAQGTDTPDEAKRKGDEAMIALRYQDALAHYQEGLKKAQGRRYALFIVDIEMPGINGFEFVARAKADPGLRRVPVIMVTSLASAADKKRGADVGVDAYIVKGEFDQKHFVQKVRDLVGMSHA